MVTCWRKICCLADQTAQSRQEAEFTPDFPGHPASGLPARDSNPENALRPTAAAVPMREL